MLSQAAKGSNVVPERRLALIHRVVVPDEEYPKEYSILVTDQRSIFIRQEKTRSSFVLRQEMRIGTAHVTDVIPKALEDYEETSLQTLKADKFEYRKRDFFVRIVMKRQKEIFQVYNFEMNYWQSPDRKVAIRFYAVPLGMYFKPRRQPQTRETILREYAADTLQIFREVLPTRIITP